MRETKGWTEKNISPMKAPGDDFDLIEEKTLLKVFDSFLEFFFFYGIHCLLIFAKLFCFRPQYLGAIGRKPKIFFKTGSRRRNLAQFCGFQDANVEQQKTTKNTGNRPTLTQQLVQLLALTLNSKMHLAFSTIVIIPAVNSSCYNLHFPFFSSKAAKTTD